MYSNLPKPSHIYDQVRRRVLPDLSRPFGFAVPVGTIGVWDINEAQRWASEPDGANHNTFLYSWGFIAARAIGRGDPLYKIARMYIEFKNVASPGDTVATPSFSRGDGLSYFNSLPSDQDFLRVPLLAEPPISIMTGYESYFNEANDEGNVLTFYAQTTGTTGVLGRTFSDSVNSKVFGVTLVACPDDSDRTKDVILSRGYLAGGQQKLKLSSSQIGLTWQTEFL